MTPRYHAMEGALPIEIRPNQHVWIKGIPHDLSAAEARKIAEVVLALAPASKQCSR